MRTREWRRRKYVCMLISCGNHCEGRRDTQGRISERAETTAANTRRWSVGNRVVISQTVVPPCSTDPSSSSSSSSLSRSSTFFRLPFAVSSQRYLSSSLLRTKDPCVPYCTAIYLILSPVTQCREEARTMREEASEVPLTTSSRKIDDARSCLSRARATSD